MVILVITPEITAIILINTKFLDIKDPKVPIMPKLIRPDRIGIKIASSTSVSVARIAISKTIPIIAVTKKNISSIENIISVISFLQVEYYVLNLSLDQGYYTFPLTLTIHILFIKRDNFSHFLILQP